MICKIIDKTNTEASIELLNGYVKKVPISILPENSSIGQLITIDDIIPKYRASINNISNFI